MKKSVMIASFMTLSFFAKGQDAGEGLNQDEQLARHSLGLAIAHAQSFEGRDENNDRKTLALSCWSLDYNYHINSTWAVGLHTDFILQKFRIEESDPNRPGLLLKYDIPTLHTGYPSD